MIGKKLVQLRKEKGFTQEDLSDKAGINLRTLQRIEKGETEPRGNTLQLLCTALDVPLESMLEHGQTEDNGYLSFLHLSVLSFMLIPMGNILIPFILWMVKRDRIVGLHQQATGLISFQILWTLIVGACFFIFAFGKLESFHVGFAPLIPIGIFYLFNLVYPIWVAMRISKGYVKAYYPEALRFIR